MSYFVVISGTTSYWSVSARGARGPRTVDRAVMETRNKMTFAAWAKSIHKFSNNYHGALRFPLTSYSLAEENVNEIKEKFFFK